MDDHNLIHSLNNGERVASNYAEIYHNDEHCPFKPKPVEDKDIAASTSKRLEPAAQGVWISPSDLLIGKVDLVPPFTSRITRGLTHDGILKIGQAVLDRERAKFLKRLNALLADNDAAWLHIQEEEKKIIAKKVHVIYKRIFDRKNSMMQKEMSWFYEDSLRELEQHLRSEVRTILMSTHCNTISELNREITQRLEIEKKILVKELRQKYDREVRKMNKYYQLLLHNEKYRSNQLVNQALERRNQALNIFCKQVDAEATSSTMYVMSTERKKCKMRRFLLENFHANEIEEKLKLIRERQEILEEFRRDKKDILDINKEWEEKIKKILQLFLKFISFSLKLLPEQTTFLLDLEKLLVLQLNEIQKYPEESRSILINEDDFINLFEFTQPEKLETVCEKEPFVIVGDLTPSVSTQYGSRESIPLHKELPYFRVQRQFIYAKCEKYEEVKKLLRSKTCLCHYSEPKEPAEVESSTSPEPTPTPPVSTLSSNEPFLVDDIARLEQCPSRGCQQYLDKLGFPNLDDYLDYTQEKFMRVQTILGKPAKLQPETALLSAKEIVFREIPFTVTKERHRTVETQYSSQEDLVLPADLPCTCIDESKKSENLDIKSDKNLQAILRERKESLKRLMHDNPKLMNLFSEESYDFIY